jgi:hypothetical protein
MQPIVVPFVQSRFASAFASKNAWREKARASAPFAVSAYRPRRGSFSIGAAAPGPGSN